MAVYRFEQGVFTRVDALDGHMLGQSGSAVEMARNTGMVLLDDVEGVYELFARHPDDRSFTRLSGYRWWFRLVDELGAVDDVLIRDDLPAYLDFLARLEPLVRRRGAARGEVERELGHD